MVFDKKEARKFLLNRSSPSPGHGQARAGEGLRCSHTCLYKGTIQRAQCAQKNVSVCLSDSDGSCIGYCFTLQCQSRSLNLIQKWCVCRQQIHFGVMSPDEIVKASELQVYERSLYKVICRIHKALLTIVYTFFWSYCTGLISGTVQMPERKPAPNGTLDPRLVCMQYYSMWYLCSLLTMHTTEMQTACCAQRMAVSLMQGVSNRATKCTTCGQNLADCTGHFGELTESCACIPFFLPHCQYSADLHNKALNLQFSYLVSRVHQAVAASVPHWVPEEHTDDTPVHLQDLLQHSAARRRLSQIPAALQVLLLPSVPCLCHYWTVTNMGICWQVVGY